MAWHSGSQAQRYRWKKIAWHTDHWSPCLPEPAWAPLGARAKLSVELGKCCCVDSGEARIRQLGYKQELRRNFGLLSNASIGFTAISILTGITGQFSSLGTISVLSRTAPADSQVKELELLSIIAVRPTAVDNLPNQVFSKKAT